MSKPTVEALIETPISETPVIDARERAARAAFVMSALEGIWSYVDRIEDPVLTEAVSRAAVIAGGVMMKARAELDRVSKAANA